MRFIVVALALVGCHDGTRPWPGIAGAPVDAGLPDNDGSIAADTSSMSCAQIESALHFWLDAHRSCVADGDCAFADLVCITLECSGSYAATALGPYLYSLVNAWRSRPCVDACLACPKQTHRPVCSAGICSIS